MSLFIGLKAGIWNEIQLHANSKEAVFQIVLGVFTGFWAGVRGSGKLRVVDKDL